MATKELKKKGEQLIEKLNNRNTICQKGLKIDTASNERLKEISDKFWDKNKRKRTGNYEAELQKDIDKITKSIKVG